jgi:hypothetical protein
VYSDGAKQDTIPTAVVNWKNDISRQAKSEQCEKLKKLLKDPLDSDNIRVVEIN